MADKEAELVQQYRFKVRTGDGREVVSPVATVSHPSVMVGAQVIGPNLSMLWAEVPVKQILVAVKGKQQGDFHSDGGFTDRAGNAGVHQVSTEELSFAVSSPRDAQTGQPTGKRMHQPVVFSKANGPSTLQFLQALTTNEALPLVIFDCYGVDAQGQTRLAHSVKLTNASVSEVTFQKDDVRVPANAALADTLEISLTYQKIEVDHGPLAVTDDWA
jgi:type VI secretion system secreted protein Hcp